MSSNTTADKVTQAIVEIVRQKQDAGQYADAENVASKWINSIKQGKPEVQIVFAPALLKLYALRAYSRYMLASNNAGARQRAQEDVENALTSLDVCGGLVTPEVASHLRDDIRSLISDDATVRKASLEAVINAAVHCMASAPAVASPPLAATASAPAVASPPLAASVGQSLKVYAIPFGVGLGLWALVVLLVVVSGSQHGVVLALSIFGFLMLAMRGWDWFSQYKFGTYGNFWKFVALLFILLTFVGLIPIIYWTGKGTLRVLGIWKD